jgi:putative transposase
MVVIWTPGPRPDSELVNTMLEASIDTVQSSGSKPIIHSASGAHFRWPGWLDRVHSAKLTRSTSGKG